MTQFSPSLCTALTGDLVVMQHSMCMAANLCKQAFWLQRPLSATKCLWRAVSMEQYTKYSCCSTESMTSLKWSSACVHEVLNVLVSLCFVRKSGPKHLQGQSSVLRCCFLSMSSLMLISKCSLCNLGLKCVFRFCTSGPDTSGPDTSGPS